MFEMSLPKGFGSATTSQALDVEAMIGKRVENMTGLITISFLAAWLATLGGTTVGYVYYPWAYPAPSAAFAFGGLTVFEAIGYIFCIKVSQEGSKRNDNKVLAVVLGTVAVATLLLNMFPVGAWF